MARKIINDIVISKKSIRQIPLSPEKKKKGDRELRKAYSWQRKSLNPKLAIWIIAVICLLALFFGLSLVFSSATVIITPRTEKISFNNETYITKLDSSAQTDLSFEVLNVKQTEGQVVEATEEKEVSQKASGKIVIYNNYSTVSQRLINKTRFEASNGKVYRINSSVIVPGLKKVNGQTLPGSIEAVVYADQAGEDYNLKLADLAGDFKIPGFKGDPRYQGFYARLKTDITGGLIGKQRIVSNDLRKVTEDLIKVKLKEQLLKELYAVKPENYLIFKDGYIINYSRLPDMVVDKNSVKINLEGNLSAVVFNSLKLSKYFAVKKIEGFDGLPTEFISTDSLIVLFKPEDLSSLGKNKTLEIKLTGEGIIKWQYDSEALKQDLVGKSEADFKNLMVKYKNSVSGIKVFFRPIWTRYFPDNINKIRIQEENLL
ncbi:MAG: hypothetical protein A2541_00155 [Candidatus Taylorbacteria bacterium RIFOXYD2_FULL_36_9]|uniref:Baseplate protein J-like domain-containing protein n=1 Tax=Candidatus Taylorbacteria bacterium RIFOXYD2_FULL_36_9 TaxID=1802338 RepID=A0A1G2PDT9_9BACT|nr:MAG: hypothetical protein A2541_00155 [Candidatus Taylorbacteria bacterium RIFOXYD2_FULL_36_9]